MFAKASALEMSWQEFGEYKCDVTNTENIHEG
jgi:hypothetical protein